MHGLQRGVDLVSMDCENCEYGIGHFLYTLYVIHGAVVCIRMLCVYSGTRVEECILFIYCVKRPCIY